MATASPTIERTEHRVGAGISTTILFYLLLFSVTGSITAAEWSDNLGIITFAAAGGATLSILFANIRRMPGALAHLIILILTAPVTATLGTLVLPDVLTFEEKLVVLFERVWAWANIVLVGGSGTDNLIFVLQLCAVMWLIAYIAGWSIYRQHQVWGALVPTGCTILLNLFYAAPQSGLYIGMFILSAMLLLVRLNLQSMEQSWRRTAVGYSPDISLDFLWYGALVTLILMVMVWILPASPPGPAWLEFLEPLQSPWQSFEDQFNRLFSSLNPVPRPASAAFFGSTLSLGGPIKLGQRPIMDIEALYARYWRAATYDKYSGVGWVSTQLDLVNLNANDLRLDGLRDLLRVEVTQTVKVLVNDRDILYAQSQPIRFSIPVEIRYTKTPSPEAAPTIFDVSLVRSRRPLREGSRYVVTSYISVTDEESLRADSVNYPSTITRYLQLPDELPVRVRNLAKEIAAQSDNPYDQATALEKYVRKHVKYSESVSPPPPNRDGVDYTLFERPEGYCNYYASALAVMARAVGIPARVVSGYSLGEFESGTFRIVEANAHSWVEIYFPSYGWVEFEPTANKPEIERPKRQTSNVPPDPRLDDAEKKDNNLDEKELDDNPRAPAELTRPWWNDPTSLALVGGGFVGVMLVGLSTMIIVRQARRNARLLPAARTYERMLNRVRWLGIREEKFATPIERARIINGVLPKAQIETEHIAASYTRERFGARKLDETERAELAGAWSKWRGEWLRGASVRVIERISKPLRAMMARLRKLKQRFERMQ